MLNILFLKKGENPSQFHVLIIKIKNSMFVCLFYFCKFKSCRSSKKNGFEKRSIIL